MASLIGRNKIGSYNESFCPKIVILESTVEMERNISVLVKNIFLMCPEKMYPTGVASVQQDKLGGSCSSKENF